MTPRLLAIAPVDHPGGAETTLVRLLVGLQAKGWRTALTTPGPGLLRDQALAAGIEWTALPLGELPRGTGRTALKGWPTAFRLARDADVVYLNGGVPARALPATAAARALSHRRPSGYGSPPRRPKLVLHIHDMVQRVPFFWRWADVVLAASGAVATRLQGLRAEVVYGPVDPDPPTATPPWATGNGPVIGFVGRLEPRKGPLDLIAAVPAIRASVPEARVVIVGDEPYGLAPDYTRAVLASTDVEHHPWSDNAPGLMRHLDVLVLPSYEEPFGTVLAEAMAVGTPVVATRVDGLPEVVQDGVTGRLVNPGDPQRLAEAVVEVLAHRREMSGAARDHARRFHTDSYVDHVERLIAP